MASPLPTPSLRLFARPGAAGHLCGTVGATLAVLLLSLGPSAAEAQRMPLALVEGSRYTRRTTDAQGGEEACQELAVGRLATDGTELVATLAVSPCGSGAASESARGTIRCRTEDAEMVMTAMALLGPEGRDVALRASGGAVLYPGPPAEPTALDDASLDVTVESGTLGFLGGRSRIDLTERRVYPEVDGDLQKAGAYTVTEAVRLRAYVLGIRVKDRRYQAVHTLLPDGHLIRQVLTGTDGTTITLTLAGI